MLVVGAGFAGLSTAYHLAKKGVKNIVVLEKENRLGGHASGRNAGMIRQAITDPVLAMLAIEGARALKRANQSGDDLRYVESGSLFLSNSKNEGEIESTQRTLKKLDVSSFIWDKNRSAHRVSLLSNAVFEKALFCPSDANLNIEKLLQTFLSKLKKMGVRVFLGREILSVKKNGNLFQVKTTKADFEAKIIVNAAGAWAPVLAQMAGASKISLRAYRRHLFESRGFKDFKKDWPFVWHLEKNLYFRPYGNELLLSPCDKTLCEIKLRGSKSGIQKEIINPEAKKNLLKKLRHFSPGFKSIRLGKGKSGLRTMAPDGRFVIGEDAKLSGFYWVAGLGGHGVTTSFSVGRLASDLILGKKVDRVIEKAVSPKRFLKGK